MANTSNFSIEKPVSGGSRNSWGGLLNLGTDKLSELLALALPIGSIQMYPIATAPAPTSGVSSTGGKWLVCDGSLVTRNTYSALFSVIGTTYGAGDGSSNFALPDLRSRVPVGYNVNDLSSVQNGQRSTRAIGLGSGAETHTLQNTEIPKHTHPVTDAGHVHPIAEQTHEHTGAVNGSNGLGTSNASLTILDPEHSHTFPTVTEWASQSGSYGVAFDNGPFHQTVTTTSSATGIQIADHNHSFTTTANSANISTTQTNPSGRITTTNEQADGNGPHNNMPPFLVVNYIILAAHPTFT